VPPLRISWVDVFTDRPFGGNPLAVVPDADGLDESAMQSLARELGLSETVFAHADGRELRIFTPAAELPLAGHPVVGAALELARLGRIPADGAHNFRTRAGDVHVEVHGEVATMTQLDPQRGRDLDPRAVAPLLGLGADRIVGTPAACTTTGVRQAFARVADRATLAAVAPDLAGIAALSDLDGLAAWCEDGGELAQRFFAPQIGVDEDPATGSAAGALGALRVFEGAPPGSLVVRQGEELGRPSTIQVAVAGEPGSPREVRVAGRAALVLEAELRARLPRAGGAARGRWM
jgi:trans-2,3-dihydro-3-hydroxyanthranilate isomerase